MMDIRNKFDIDLPRAKGAYLNDAPETIFTEKGWTVEVKEDGLRLSLQLGMANSLMVGRNRQDFLKGVEAAKKFRDLSYKNPLLAKMTVPALDGTLLDGELTETFKGATKMAIAGGDSIMINGVPMMYDKYTITRMAEGKFAGYVVWDCLFWKWQDIRHLPLRLRRKAAAYTVQALANPKIKMIDSYPCTEVNLEKLFDAGEEGGIAKNLSHPIPVGQRTHSGYWKLKGSDNRTVDAFIIGVTQGTSGGSGLTGKKAKLNGMAASFTMAMLKGQLTVEVGKMKHLPDRIAETGFKNFELYKGMVVEMKVSGFDGDRFRWPRWLKHRPDKTKNDCLFSEQVGKEK